MEDNVSPDWTVYVCPAAVAETDGDGDGNGGSSEGLVLGVVSGGRARVGRLEIGVAVRAGSSDTHPLLSTTANAKNAPVQARCIGISSGPSASAHIIARCACWSARGLDMDPL
jgi:hypothetical protein